MNGVLNNLLSGLSDIWKSIGITQKVSIILTILVSLGICIAVVYYGTRPDWQVLYGDMDSKTAAKVCDILNDSGVKMKLTNGGKTILVAGADVYKLRLEVAKEGIETNPLGAGGWEVFDNLPIGATELQQQIAKQRAIQGELEKMINTIPGVAASRVMIAIPPKSIYRKDRVSPTAAVTLTISGGRMIDQQSINAIRYIISSSVPRMTPENVTITDSNGTLLARQRQQGEGLAGEDSSHQMEIQNKMERQLKEKAESILRPIVGPKNVEAHVACDIDFDSVDKVIESYDVENTAVLTEKVITEDMVRNGKSNGGKTETRNSTAGVNGENMADSQEVNLKELKEVTAPKLASEQKKISERTFAVPKTVQKIAAHSGKLKRITVAVAVNKREDGKLWNLDDLKRLVSGAVGADIYRENFQAEDDKAPAPVVTVVETDFYKDTTPAPQVPIIDEVNYNWNKIWSLPFAKPLLGILMLLGMFILFRKYFHQTTDENPEVQQLDVYSEDLKQLGENTNQDAVENVANALAENKEEHGEEQPNNNIMEILRSKNASSPQLIAAVMENWLQQEP